MATANIYTPPRMPQQAPQFEPSVAMALQRPQLVAGVSMAWEQPLFQDQMYEMSVALATYLQAKKIRGAGMPMARALLGRLTYRCSTRSNGETVGVYELAELVDWEAHGPKYMALFAHVGERTLVLGNFSDRHIHVVSAGWAGGARY
ncbi:hypothetical protein IWQ56_001121 [Coemansia nantahalensis]|nr:hypothetical protein IWQ56_001121 [Coemansia nantahalensis]